MGNILKVSCNGIEEEMESKCWENPCASCPVHQIPNPESIPDACLLVEKFLTHAEITKLGQLANRGALHEAIIWQDVPGIYDSSIRFMGSSADSMGGEIDAILDSIEKRLTECK